MRATSADVNEKLLYPSPKVAWVACAVLFLGCALAFMDRAIISLFVIPIQRDLHLSDTQISLLVGFAFGAFNALFGLPVARWIDGGRRRTIAAIGIAVWSLAAACCGLAGNFWQLFLGRVGVGAGEASVTPAGVSLLADFFPPSRRGVAMGVFYAGIYLGGGCALILGGLLWRNLGDRQIVLPLVGPIHSWGVVLILVAALGLLVAPLTMMIREPERLDGGRRARAGNFPLSTVVQYYKTHARTLIGHNVGFCLQNFALHAGAAWLPTLLVRTDGWSIARAGATVGVGWRSYTGALVVTQVALSLLLLAGAAVAQTPGEFPQGANVPKNMKQYFLCLLEKGEKHKPMQFADPEMQEHLAYIREQVEAGKYVVVGPALDAGRIGGMAIINAATAEEAKKIVNGDKMVQSGKLVAEIHPVMLADLSALHTEYPAKTGK